MLSNLKTELMVKEQPLQDGEGAMTGSGKLIGSRLPAFVNAPQGKGYFA